MSRRQLISAFSLLGLLLAAPAAQANPGDLQGLPVQLSAGCVACHSGPGASATQVPAAVSSQLSQFGADWLYFGRVWGPDMAQADSDLDNCSNGGEFGDPKGDWVVGDDYIEQGSQDPTTPGDCSKLPLDESSFSALKSLFSEE